MSVPRVPPPPHSSPLTLWAGPVAVFLTLLAFLYDCLQSPAHLDDAYISYRYAKNLVAGHGLVFNPGEYVEGMTNLLWTLFVALGIALGFSAKAVAGTLGFIFGAATLVATYLFARRILDDDRLALAAPALVYASTPFAAWTTAGMETPLFVWAVTWSVMSVARQRFDLAFLAATIATLTRPDGALVAGVAATFWFVDAYRNGWRGARWPALYAGAVLLMTGFRLAYYGSPVPNTFYAKVGGVPIESGVFYLRSFLASGPGLLLPTGLLAIALDRRLWSAGLLVGMLALYVVGVGGDVFPDSRFLLPALPCLAVLALRGVQISYTKNMRLGALAAALIVTALVIQPVGTEDWRMPAFLLAASAVGITLARGGSSTAIAATAIATVVAIPILLTHQAMLNEIVTDSARSTRLGRIREYAALVEYSGARQARFLNGLAPPPVLIATSGLGVRGFYADFPVIDVFGLVVPEVAHSSVAPIPGIQRLPGHQRSNADVILSRRPDLIVIPHSIRGTAPRLPAFIDLWRHPVLKSDYVWDEEFGGYRRKAYTPKRNRAM